MNRRALCIGLLTCLVPTVAVARAHGAGALAQSARRRRRAAATVLGTGPVVFRKRRAATVVIPNCPLFLCKGANQ